MSLRNINSNEIIKELISYDPEKLLLENIRRGEKRWTERKVISTKVMMNLLNTEDKPVILSLHGICYDIYNVIIFCFLNVRIITQFST